MFIYDIISENIVLAQLRLLAIFQVTTAFCPRLTLTKRQLSKHLVKKLEKHSLSRILSRIIALESLATAATSP